MTGWLNGKRVLITRPREQAEETARLFESSGALAVVAPAIAIKPPADIEPLRRALTTLDSFDWVVFTSANGVTAAFTEHRALGLAAKPWTARIAAVGPKTAKALEQNGVHASLLAKQFIAESLADDLIEELRPLERPARILLLQAEIARDVLAVNLAEAGHAVSAVPAYATLGESGEGGDDRGASELLELFDRGIDVVTFASPSAVKSVWGRLGEAAAEILRSRVIASIGPVTTKAAEELSIRVDVTADPHTLAGLVQSLERWGQSR